MTQTGPFLNLRVLHQVRTTIQITEVYNNKDLLLAQDLKYVPFMPVS